MPDFVVAARIKHDHLVAALASGVVGCVKDLAGRICGQPCKPRVPGRLQWVLERLWGKHTHTGWTGASAFEVGEGGWFGMHGC